MKQKIKHIENSVKSVLIHLIGNTPVSQHHLFIKVILKSGIHRP